MTCLLTVTSALDITDVVEARKSGPRDDEAQALSNGLVEQERKASRSSSRPSVFTAPGVMDIAAMIDRLEAIDAEVVAILFEREAEVVKSVKPLVDLLVDVGCDLALVDEHQRGRLAAALNEPGKAGLRTLKDLSIRLVSLDLPSQIALVEEELSKIEPEPVTDDSDEEEEDDF